MKTTNGSCVTWIGLCVNMTFDVLTGSFFYYVL